MIRPLRTLAILLFCLSLLVRADAQSPAPSAAAEAAELVSLTKKIDEQNIKIDLLSQQILHLQEAIEHP
jgi:predicted ATP-grasp superfamily ATP-dependent carboligase